MLKNEKKQQSMGWPQKPQARLLTVRAVLATTFATAMILVCLGPVAGTLDTSAIEHPLELRTRALLGQQPSLDSRLKVFALDNSTYAKLRTPWLDGALWSKILTHVGEAKPAFILTSHMFGSSEFRDSDLAQSLSKLHAQGTPVFASAFPWAGVIRHRAPLKVSAEIHDAKNWSSADGPLTGDSLQDVRRAAADWREFQLYGMTEEEASHFAGIGHVDYRGDGKIQPLARLQGDRFVAHLSLLAAASRRVSSGRILLNDKLIPTGPGEPALVDFVETSEILAKARSIDSLLQRIDAGSVGEIIKPGDVVYIATDLYTGRSNFVPTPLGPVPGSLVMISAINSVIQGRWIRDTGGDVPLTMIGAGVGALIGWTMSSAGAVAALSLIAGCVAVLSILLTGFFGLSVPWLLPSLGCLISGSVVITMSSWLRRIENEKERLAAATEAGKFSAMVRTAQMLAHDIRRPFSIIDTAVRGLQTEGDPARIKRLLNKLTPDLDRAKQSVEVMIGDILEIDRASKPRMTPRAPGEVLSISLRDSLIRLRPRDIAIKSQWDHTLRINVDESKIRRTFCNIIENAIEAMQGSGTLWIKTSDEWQGQKSWVKIVIGNDGPWIPPESRTQIFEPFWTSSKPGGTGLGLALAKKVVEAHGGQIGCDSNANKSTEFWILLPAVWDTPIRERPKMPQHSQDMLEDKHQHQRLSRVAVIDDSAFMLEAWTNELSDASVVTFSSPEDFLKACSDSPEFLTSLDLIIVDYQFSEHSLDHGLVLAGRIKSMRQIPIVLCTDWPVTDPVASVVTDAQIPKSPISLRAIWNLLRKPLSDRFEFDQEA